MEVKDKQSCKSEKEGILWNCLTIENQEELLLALEESEDPN
jgi:hypothetical protein